jgi:hypothetical protein
MAKAFELKGKVIAQYRSWRLDRALERNRIALKATVGMYIPPAPHEFVADAEEPRFCAVCEYQSGAEHHVGTIGMLEAQNA